MRAIASQPLIQPQRPFKRLTPRFPEPLIRLTDVSLSLVALVLLGPLMLLIAAAIYLSDGHSPLFKQKRIGFQGRRFNCFKFRSMRPDADIRLAQLLAEDAQTRVEWQRDHKLRNDPRVTPLGRFLRKSSLDELPQFINVLRGDMSLVGPRPIVDSESAKYGSRFSHYCSLRPGITGLWQVSGRSSLSYRRRVACDVLYARRRSLGLNLKILMSTVPAVLKARGSC